MPLKRTPPKQQILSETDSESVEGSVSDMQNYNDQANINTRRMMKRKQQENDLSNFMQEVRDSFAKFSEQHNLKLQSLESSLAEIKSQNDSINTSMQVLSSNYDVILKELESLKSERKEHLAYINSLENKIELLENQSCASKIELRNIPKLQNESKTELCNVVKKIGNVLNLHLQNSDIKDIYRPFAKPNVLKPIVVEFTSVLTKESVLNSVKNLTLTQKTEKLNTNLLGLDSPRKPIFVSDCLTPKGRRLFFLARDFATTYQYTYCWTSYGKIYLRKKEGMPHIRINGEQDLIKLKNELKATE